MKRSGPEHYVEAEKLLDLATSVVDFHHRHGFTSNEAQAFAVPVLTRAQVHATLAVAAATAMQPAGEDFIPSWHWPEFNAWAQVCAASPPEREEVTP